MQVGIQIPNLLLKSPSLPVEDSGTDRGQPHETNPDFSFPDVRTERLAATAVLHISCLPAPQAASEAGVAYSDVQLPFLMRAVYGSRSPKFVFLLRNPVDRIYSAYFG